MAQIEKIALGAELKDMKGLKDAYKEERSENRWDLIEAVLDGDKLLDFIKDYAELLCEPVYFFLELPCSEEEESEIAAETGEKDGCRYKLYYLDNCTAPVVRAVLKRFGNLLVNDGICRFGFGRNDTFDEIYVQSYKVMRLYFASEDLKTGALELLKKYGAEKTDRLLTPWDLISPENPGVCATVEEDGVNVYSIPDILSDAGMYYAETVGQ